MLTTVLGLSLHAQGAAAHTSVTSTGLPLGEMIKAFHMTFYLMAGLSLVGFLLSLRLRDRLLEAHKRGMMPGGIVEAAKELEAVEA